MPSSCSIKRRFFFYYSFVLRERESYYIPHADLKFQVLLLQFPRPWVYNHGLPCPASRCFLRLGSQVPSRLHMAPLYVNQGMGSVIFKVPFRSHKAVSPSLFTT